jgi:TatD DNase family protein
MLVDSHCHLDRLDLSPYRNDFSQFMVETTKRGIEHMLCVSINLGKYPGMRSLTDPHANISVSVGVHPNEQDGREPSIEELVTLANDPKVVAIGETGLDYYRSEGDLSWQQERFRRHIRAARECGKPLIIHTREAREDTLRILAEEGADEVSGVLHCFTEDWETARRALDLGFYISFSGILTFKNAQIIQDTAKKVPEDRLLVETDSPYLAPIPFRGKPNYPSHVYHVADFLAKLRGVSLDQMAAVTTRNFYSLFPVRPA